MSTLAISSIQPASMPPSATKSDPMPAFDVGKVKIVPLPRRSDEIYMRGLRRPRA